MKKSNLAWMMVLLLPGFFALQGCLIGIEDYGYYEDAPVEHFEGEGSLVARWNFAGTGVCPVDSDTVVLQIRDASGAAVMDDILMNCANGAARIPNLPEGDYFVTVIGIDVDDNITWESVEHQVTIFGGTETAQRFQLFPTEDW